MARKASKHVGFDQALVHMKAGKKALRASWDRDLKFMRIDETGLGTAGEFVRIDNQNRCTRYIFPTEDILAEDWVLL